jgi:hypothetical protein
MEAVADLAEAEAGRAEADATTSAARVGAAAASITSPVGEQAVTPRSITTIAVSRLITRTFRLRRPVPMVGSRHPGPVAVGSRFRNSVVMCRYALREPQREDGPLTWPARDSDVAAVQAGVLAGDGQAQSGAATTTRTVRLVEPIEHAWQVLW